MHKQVVRGMLGGGDDGENQMSNCFGATDARNERTRVRVSCNLRLSHHRIQHRCGLIKGGGGRSRGRTIIAVGEKRATRGLPTGSG